jgi:hypothetical protein
MGQNRSSAVMQQRSEPHDSLDDFPTPPWATRAACEFIANQGLTLSGMSVREPCANRGYMVRPLLEHFGAVIASDVHDYGAGFPVQDYLYGLDAHFSRTDWTFMNPPFRLAAEFIERALRLSNVGVAAIVRTAFLEGMERFQTLWSVSPPWAVAVHVERVPMFRGRVDAEGASATSYSWIFWRTDTAERLPIGWIPPCRKRLERLTDYPEAERDAVESGGLLHAMQAAA